MVTVRVATSDDVDRFCAMQIALFREDAGSYDALADLTWPARESTSDFEGLQASATALVLLATDDAGEAVGFLVGYVSPPERARMPVQLGVLRSLYVTPEVRGAAVADELVERFIAWSLDQGCAAVTVDAYAQNERAQRFYARHGFAAHSIQRVRHLPVPRSEPAGSYRWVEAGPAIE